MSIQFLQLLVDERPRLAVSELREPNAYLIGDSHGSPQDTYGSNGIGLPFANAESNAGASAFDVSKITFSAVNCRDVRTTGASAPDA